MQKALLLVCAAFLALAVAACRGGGTPPPATQGAVLDGQLIQGGDKVVSAAGDGLAGVAVELIEFDNGRVRGSTMTTADGRFMFRELPNGQFLLKIRFQSSADLDGDGLLDMVESFIPVELVDDVVTLLTAALDFVDEDEDSMSDSLKIDVRIRRGENGPLQAFVKLQRHRHGDILFDRDGDGNFEDRFDDDDNNGLPDDEGFDRHPRGPKLRGEIEAISDTSLTVAGQTFLITGATVFRIRGNFDADPAEFEVGDEVMVTSFVNSDGDRVALEVKLKKHKDDDDDIDDELEIEGEIEALSETSITVAGQTFTITGQTTFLFNDKSLATFADFAVGDIVEVKARLIDGEWIALRIKMEEEGDDDEDERTVSGAIEAITATSVTVNGEAFVIDAGTMFELFGGGAGTIDDFMVGANVELTADLEAGVWVVRVIRLTDEPELLQDFSMDFIDFDPHIGHTLYLKVVDEDTGAEVGSITPFAITSGEFNVLLPAILEPGMDYVIDFWADFDGDGMLDGTPLNGGVDHAWRLMATAGATGIDLDFVHDTNFTDIRPFFDVELEDFSINFTMYDPHIGDYFYLKVKDAVTGDTVGTVTPFIVTSAAFSLSLDDILVPGKEYNVDFWADFDNSGDLDGTPLNGGNDHAWRLTATAAAGTGIMLNHVHDTDFTDIRPF